MKKIYYLSTCNTCKKILKELNPSPFFELQDIKYFPITEGELDNIKKLSGSYSSLFNKKAQLYRKMGLAEKELTEEDYKRYILEHYTFLKRPIIIVDEMIFLGSPSKIILTARDYMW